MMVKVNCCDVCFYRENEKVTPSKYRSGYKGMTRIDLCQAHKDVLKQDNVTYSKYLQWCQDLMFAPKVAVVKCLECMKPKDTCECKAEA